MNTAKFFRLVVVLNGIVPLGVLIWDAYLGQLGANSVNYAIHVTGILSLIFLILSLLITPMRWVSGWGGWIACRRALGLYAFFYAVIHLGLYVVLDREGSLPSTFREIWSRRFLQIGTAGLLLMVPLAATSTNAMIQKLGPKRWKLLHRSSYIVAVLGVVHYYMLVKSDVRQPVAFGVVVAALLLARIIKKLHASKTLAKMMGRNLKAETKSKLQGGKPSRFWKGELQVESIVEETPNVKTFRLVHPLGEDLPFEYLPGQYMNLQLNIDGNLVHRSYTIASSPSHRGWCELSIKRETGGLASSFLHERVSKGDMLRVSAPAGRFVFTGEKSDSVVLVAGGVGITPVMSILRFLTDRKWKGEIYFIFVAKTESDIVFRNELEMLATNFPNLHLCVTLTRPKATDNWTGKVGRPDGLLFKDFVPGLTKCPVFLCGPNAMMDSTKHLLASLGVREEMIHTEAFVSPSASRPTDNLFSTSSVNTSVGMSSTTARLFESDGNQSAENAFMVEFVRSNRNESIAPSSTILEAAESCSVDLPFECRSGVCGHCKTRLLKGKVHMDNQEALSHSEVRSGWILACQAHPQSDVIVEA